MKTTHPRIFTLSFILLIVLFNSHKSIAQQYCGFDAYKLWHQENDPQVADNIRHADERINQYLQLNPWLRGGGDIYTIPVVVHIIHQNGAENIPDEQVEDAIEWLNDAFTNSGFYSSDDGIVTQVRFCLAHLDPDGEFSTGINRIESELTTVVIPNEDLQLKDLSRWDPYSYLNIWIVSQLIRADENESIIGNSSMPVMHGSDADGVIIEAAFFGSSENLTKAFIHEVGHYLGLYHTFEGGCNNDNCLEDGDHVCDTPPDTQASSQSCFGGTNSCTTDVDDESANNPFRPVGLGGLGDQVDMQQNYMDYSSLTCYEFFTSGQSDRMAAALLEIRASLLEGDRCNPPCTDPITANITVSSDTIFLGNNIFFDNNSLNADEVTWFVNEEIVATSTDYTFIPDEEGSYFIEVLLENDQPGCNVEMEYHVEVLCPTTATFTGGGNNFLQNVPVEFINTSENGLSSTWTVDGNFYSNATNITVTFSTFGTHQVCLTSTGPLCTASNCQLIAIGNCATGNENRNWITYTGEESINRLHFSEQGTIYTTEIIQYSESKSTISDENGQLLFSTNGEELYDENLAITPNGDDLLGGFSSRQGSIFIKAPASDVLYYLFYTDMQEDDFEDGLRYCLIDRTLNNGLGDIVDDQKNIFISSPQTEAITAIRHCNYEDFWLLYYNVSLERYEAWLITSEGVASEPVTFDFPQSNFTSGTTYYYDIRVSPRGDYFIHNKNLLHFDASNGTISLHHQFDFFEVSFYDFSPTGHYLILQSQSSGLQVFLHQIDITLPPDEMEDEMFTMNQPLFAIYSDIQRTPNGEILMAGVFAGVFDIIHFPELPGDEMDLEYGAVEEAGFTNSFGNYFHAYSQAPVFIDGITKLCEDKTSIYSIHGCADGQTAWTVFPDAQLSPQPGGEMAITFPEPGIYEVSVTLETTCGVITGSVQVQVADGIAPNLGPDMNICSGEFITLELQEEFETYLWDNGSEAATRTVNSVGIYSVTTTDASGCEYSDEIEILEVIDASIDLGPDFDYCDSTIVILDAGDAFLDYLWQDGASGSTYTVFEAGTYTVTATIPCDATDTILIDSCHDGILGLAANETILVYPNPASALLNVHLPAGWIHSRITAYDVLGKIVYENGSVMDSVHRIETSQWTEGVYELRITVENKTEFSRVLILHP